MDEFRQMSDGEIEQMLRKVAMEGMRRRPLSFLAYIPGLAWRTYFAPTDWIPAWGDTNSADLELENRPVLALTKNGLLWRWEFERVNGFLWPVICWAAIGGVLLGVKSRKKVLTLALAWVPIGYLLATASVAYFSPRYSAPIVAFAIALAVLFIDLLRTELLDRLVGLIPQT